MKRILEICILFVVSVMIFEDHGIAQAQAENTTPGSPSLNARLHVTPPELLQEEMRVGENNQPEWTTGRPFATTRVYVQQPWKLATEVGWDARFPKHGDAEHILQEEIELGLPHRFQIDFENHDRNAKLGGEEEDEGDEDVADSEDEGSDRKWKHESNSVELAYALANWGEIPLNPVLKGEWKFNNAEADAYEAKILLGDELAAGWHWGLNLFFEQQIGDDREREYAVSQAASYSLIDERFAVGVEMNFSSESDRDNRSHPENSFVIGPSFQFHPTHESHIDVVPLFGVGDDSPDVQLLVFIGFDFGLDHGHEGLDPASLRGK